MKVCFSVVSSISQGCSAITTVLIPEYFYHPQRKPYKHLQPFLIFLLSSPALCPLATTSLVSVSVDLPLLNVSYKWNQSYRTLHFRSVAGFLTWLNIFKVHEYCSMCYYSFLFSIGCFIVLMWFTFCISIHSCWTFRLFIYFFTGVMLLWIFWYKFSCGHVFQFS